MQRLISKQVLAFASSLLFITITLLTSFSSHAAVVQVINNDGAGEGFNDATPANPIGGNTGTTIGQQRMIAFQHAANIWGSVLQSAVPIRVSAQFGPLPCTTNSATIGSAGPTATQRDFVGAPYTETFYPIALANALAGVDLRPAGAHIDANFSSSIGTPGCLENSGWYYGLDKNPPFGKLDFVSTLLHELGHGLGFLSFVNLTTGSKAGGYNDIFMRNLEHHGATPSDYPSMTNAQRVAASTSNGNLHWIGPNVRAAASALTNGKLGDHVVMYAPSTAQPGSSVSHWDPSLTPNQIMEPTYTVPLHTPGLELSLFQDIGWTVNPPNSTYSLNVSKTGLGSVVSVPAGINCGADCSENYNSGTAVTLTATPNVGYQFTGWTGACSGTGTCVITMNSTNNVMANFSAAEQKTLSIAKIGTGNGIVTRSGGGLNCGNTCTESLASGTTVVLTASAQSGSVFTGWAGNTCAGSGSCAFNISANSTVTAIFDSISGGKTSTPFLHTNLADNSGTASFYSILIPAKVKNLTIKTGGGTGDVNLYVKHAQPPTTSSYDCASTMIGNAETCFYPTPLAGTYHVMLKGNPAYDGVTLAASYQKGDITTIINLLLLN